MKTIFLVALTLAFLPNAFAKKAERKVASSPVYTIAPGMSVKVGGAVVQCQAAVEEAPAAAPAPTDVYCVGKTQNGQSYEGHGYSEGESRGNIIGQCSSANPTSSGCTKSENEKKDCRRYCENVGVNAVCYH